VIAFKASSRTNTDEPVDKKLEEPLVRFTPENLRANLEFVIRIVFVVLVPVIVSWASREIVPDPPSHDEIAWLVITTAFFDISQIIGSASTPDRREDIESNTTTAEG
jgi:hypothetical protein